MPLPGAGPRAVCGCPPARSITDVRRIENLRGRSTVDIAVGSSIQVALFVAPLLVFPSGLTHESC